MTQPGGGSGAGTVFHTCLTGPNVIRDHRLIGLLIHRHQVTLVASIKFLVRTPLLRTVNVLVVECTGQLANVLTLLPALRAKLPRVVPVLVDGGIARVHLARAFRDGARDYFAAPYDAQLLAERIDSLAAVASESRDERPTS